MQNKTEKLIHFTFQLNRSEKCCFGATTLVCQPIQRNLRAQTPPPSPACCGTRVAVRPRTLRAAIITVAAHAGVPTVRCLATPGQSASLTIAVSADLVLRQLFPCHTTNPGTFNCWLKEFCSRARNIELAVNSICFTRTLFQFDFVSRFFREYVFSHVR